MLTEVVGRSWWRSMKRLWLRRTKSNLKASTNAKHETQTSYVSLMADKYKLPLRRLGTKASRWRFLHLVSVSRYLFYTSFDKYTLHGPSYHALFHAVKSPLIPSKHITWTSILAP